MTMAWIDEIAVTDAEGELADIYSELTAKRGKIANILLVHSLNPGALRTHVDLYMHLMFGRSGLSRAEREAIGVVTSANNDCAYCVEHHAEALARYERDPERMTQIRDGHFGGLGERMAAILTHTAKLTRTPASVTEQDLDALRAAGLSDAEVLDVSLVTAYFNFVNRLALGLGVAYSEEELTGYAT
jgi:uncharacterized peroxidase-related enzyme